MDGVVFGDSAKDGIMRGHHFYHSVLGFSLRFPQGWRISNFPDRLVISSPNGEALMQMTLEDINKRITPREFMITRLGLKNLTQDKQLTINGLEAHTGFAPIKTSFGGRDSRFTVIYYNNQAYILAGMCKDQATLPNYDRIFLESAQSFHAMTENEYKLAEPLRLKTIHAEKETSFESLAQQSPLEHYPEEQLRLINGMYPKGQPKEGRLLKVIK